MPQRVPSFQSNSSKFRQDIIIGGVSVTLLLEWNSRSGYWFLSIDDGTYQLENKKVVANWPILRRSRADFPSLSGDFILTQTDLEAASEVNYENLNNGWALFFYDQFELAEWESDNGVG
jgi:hypothetical protein